MTTGAQAETYADHFIAYHLTLISSGKTYSQLSAGVAGPARQRRLRQPGLRPSSAATRSAACC